MHLLFYVVLIVLLLASYILLSYDYLVDESVTLHNWLQQNEKFKSLEEFVSYLNPNYQMYID
jgi:cytochrome b561